MAEDGQPTWLGSEGGSAAAGDSQRPTATTDVFANDTDIAPEPKFKWAAVFGVAFFNLGLMVFVASCGALAIAGAQSSDDSGIVFIALYLLIFAAILFTWEIVQLTGIDVIDEWYKKNFGFLYGPMGKAAYLLFVGFLCFGMNTPRELAYACGVITCAWGPTQMLANWKFPEYFVVKSKYKP